MKIGYGTLGLVLVSTASGMLSSFPVGLLVLGTGIILGEMFRDLKKSLRGEK